MQPKCGHALRGLIGHACISAIRTCPSFAPLTMQERGPCARRRAPAPCSGRSPGAKGAHVREARALTPPSRQRDAHLPPVPSRSRLRWHETGTGARAHPPVSWRLARTSPCFVAVFASCGAHLPRFRGSRPENGTEPHASARAGGADPRRRRPTREGPMPGHRPLDSIVDNQKSLHAGDLQGRFLRAHPRHQRVIETLRGVLRHDL
jgi:hypothetical protein